MRLLWALSGIFPAVGVFWFKLFGGLKVLWFADWIELVVLRAMTVPLVSERITIDILIQISGDRRQQAEWLRGYWKAISGC